MIIALGVVAGLAVVGAVLVLVGNNPVADIVHPSARPVPEFAFKITRSEPIPTDPKTKTQQLKGSAESAGDDAAGILDAFYTQAFLDPANWEDGNYDDAWDSFDEAAAAAAQEQLAGLTAGTTAGDTFEDIQPGRSVLRSETLFDADGKPMTISATVTFKATATKKAGGSTIIVSEANFFLQQVGGEWKIISFQVDRADVERAPKPPASPSGSAS